MARSCTDFPYDAKAPFSAAAAIWGNLLHSSVPITIKACWARLSESASTDSGRLKKDFTNAPRVNTYYGKSLANALAGVDLDQTEPDMYITLNSSRNWYYGTDGDPWFWQLDLMTVALHEIGHGLSFGGAASYSGGQGRLAVRMDDGSWGSITIYDTFMKDGSGNSLTGYANPSTSLGGVLTGGNLWFHGSNAMAANGGGRVKMFAPSLWEDGRSYSHLDYLTFKDTENRLMVPDILNSVSIHDPGPITKGLLKDLGWSISNSDNNNTPNTATDLIVNGSGVFARIDPHGDIDWYRVVPDNSLLTARVTIETSGSTDTYMYLYNNLTDALNNQYSAYDDDSGEGTNAKIVKTINNNTPLYIKIRHYSNSGTGSYSIFAYVDRPFALTPIFTEL